MTDGVNNCDDTISSDSRISEKAMVSNKRSALYKMQFEEK
jgi:hypothetical protein